MAERGQIPVVFPLGGLDENWAYRRQPPYTTPALQNVRGYETIKGRARGGQRPGLGKAYAELLGGASPVRMLAQVTNVGTFAGGFFFYWGDDFLRDGDDLGPGWDPPTFLDWEESPTKIVIGGTLVERNRSGGIREALEFSTDYPYTVEMKIVPTASEHLGDYYIFARMDDDAPDVTENGIMAKLQLPLDIEEPTSYDGELTVYAAGVATTYGFTAGTAAVEAGWFRVLINGNNVQCFWIDNLLLDQEVSAHTGKRVGFALQCKHSKFYPPHAALVDIFRLQGTPETGSGSQRRRTYLVASAGGILYAERTIGQLTEVSGAAADFSSSHLFLGQERNQLLYIADYDVPRVIGTGGVIDATGTQLTDPAIADWRNYGIDTDTDVVVISGGLGLVEDGTYRISSVLESMVVLDSAAGGAGTCNYRIERAPKIYDPAENTVEIWTAEADKGQVPTGCKLICLYRDRLVLSGADQAPHLWYMARQGNPLDWEYFPEDPTDPGRAVSGQSSDAGIIGDAVTALIPFKDDYLIFGCNHSIWMLKGDPATDGRIDAVSYTVGVLGAKSWCQGPKGEVYFMSPDGLYVMVPGSYAAPKPLSPKKLPRRLKRINPETHECLLLWNDEEQGVHIYLTPKTPAAHEPMASLSPSGSPSASASPSPSPQQ